MESTIKPRVSIKKWDLGDHEPQNMPRLSVYPLGEPLGTYLTLAESEEA